MINTGTNKYVLWSNLKKESVKGVLVLVNLVLVYAGNFQTWAVSNKIGFPTVEKLNMAISKWQN